MAWGVGDSLFNTTEPILKLTFSEQTFFSEIGSPAASPQSSDNSDTHQSGGSDIEMEEQLISRNKHVQQRLSDTEVQ